MIQNLSRRCTPVLRPYGVDSHALTMTLSSSGAATGRAPSTNRLVKKSFHDVKPQYSSAGSCWYCSMPIASCARALFHPVGESLRTYLESGLFRNSPHAVRMFLSAAFTRGSR